MKFSRVNFGVALAILASSGAAQAGSKSILISGSGLRTFSGGAVTQGVESPDGVALGSAGFGQVFVSFTLPPDYKKNTTIGIALQIFGGGNSCAFHFYPSFVNRYRNNTSRTAGSAAASGLKADGPVVFNRPADYNFVQTRTYKLHKTGTGPLILGSIRNQLPGDNILAAFERQGGLAPDTCNGPLVIDAAKITYTTN